MIQEIQLIMSKEFLHRNNKDVIILGNSVGEVFSNRKGVLLCEQSQQQKKRSDFKVPRNKPWSHHRVII